MANKNSTRLPVSDRWSLLWLAVGVVLLLLSTGRFSLALASWLAPIFLIRFFHTQRLLYGYLLTVLALFVAYGIARRSNLALIRQVSVTGLWGLTFLVSWFGSVANWTWERSFAWAEVRRALLIVAGIPGLVLLFGNLRLVFGHPQPGTVRVHGFTSDRESVGEEIDIDTNRETFRRRANRSLRMVFQRFIPPLETCSAGLRWLGLWSWRVGRFSRDARQDRPKRCRPRRQLLLNKC